MSKFHRGLIGTKSDLILLFAFFCIHAHIPLVLFSAESVISREVGLALSSSPTARIDFKWAEQWHAIVDAIESRSAVSFDIASDALLASQPPKSAREAIGRDVLLKSLKRCLDSRNDGLNTLLAAWSQSDRRQWNLDILLAMYDLVERLYEDDNDARVSFQRSIRFELERRLAKTEDLLDRATVTKVELSRLAFRYVRRLPEDEDAVRQCDRLLLKLKDDFGLLSILIERLSSLHAKSDQLHAKGENPWQEKYMESLLVAKRLLSSDQKLKSQFPLAMPKVHIELSRLLQVQSVKLTELVDAIKACDEAQVSIDKSDDQSQQQKIFASDKLKELRASALWDGYTLQRFSSVVVPRPQRPNGNALFAPVKVIDALEEVANIYSGDNRYLSRFLGAKLRHASVLLDLQVDSTSTNVADAELGRYANDFITLLDSEIYDRLRIAVEQGVVLSTEESKAEALELAWIEWRMRTVVGSESNQRETVKEQDLQLPGDRKSLIARLERLRYSSHITDKDRVLMAIGYLYLTYGDYQKVIDSLDDVAQNELFAAQVMLCLAHKDSGNFSAAENARKRITDTENCSTTTLIKDFLLADLRLSQRRLPEKYLVDTLGERINETPIAQTTLKDTLTLNNQYHKAISILELSPERTPEEDSKAIKILEEHLEFEGNNRAFVRTRAAYALAEAHLQGSDECRGTVRDFNVLSSEYREKLRKYSDLRREYKDNRLSIERKQLEDQLTSLNDDHARLVSLKDEIAKCIEGTNKARRYCLAAIKEMQGLWDDNNSQSRKVIAENSGVYHRTSSSEVPLPGIYTDDADFLTISDGSFRYPNLVYNTLCLAMRIFLLSSEKEQMEFASQLRGLTGRHRNIKEVSEDARRIAFAQRLKLSKEGIFDESRNSLFERYREAFDLTVKLGTLELGKGKDAQTLEIEDVAFLGAETNNRTLVDIFGDSKSDMFVTSGENSIKNKAFISFFVGSDATHVFWKINKNEICHHRANINRSKLSDSVQNYISEFLSKDPLLGMVASAAFKDAYQLKELLFPEILLKELADAASAGRCVYVISHGPLFQLPIDTLPCTDNVDEKQEFLCDRCPPLIYLPTLSSPNVRRASADQVPKPTLLTVQPEEGTGSESKELIAIEKFKKGESLRIGPDCGPASKELPDRNSTCRFNTPALLRELERGYRIVHFGSHGGFGVAANTDCCTPFKIGDKPYLDGAYLQLWELERACNSPCAISQRIQGECRYFEAIRASDLLSHFSPLSSKRLDSELVILSACETQVVDRDAVRYGGNTIKAMGTAFLVAGAESSIASHWKVDNKSTEVLVTQFMREVANKDSLNAEEYAVLLHRERKRLKSQDEFQAPYHWGAFTLSTTLPK